MCENCEELAIKVEQLQTALNSRILIEQAVGFVTAILSTTPDESFNTLRTYARNTNQALRHVCAEVVWHNISVLSILHAVAPAGSRRAARTRLRTRPSDGITVLPRIGDVKTPERSSVIGDAK